MVEKILKVLHKLDLRHSSNLSNEHANYIAPLSADYTAFMSNYDGGAGVIGDNDNYLDLWDINNIIELNPYFPDEEFSKEVILIGSNGSGTFYGFDTLEKYYFETDEYEMSRDEVTKCGKTFIELLEYLALKQE